MLFSEVVGHEEIKKRLSRGADTGRISHAQLFTGLSGWGSLPMAVAYAQYINCTNHQNGDSCGVCPSCVKYAALAHPDLHFVFPSNSPKSGDKKPVSDNFITQWRELSLQTGMYFNEEEWYAKIGIENQQGIIARREADEVIRKLSFKSYEARYKVVVIWLPERFHEATANTLLKILEEPWEQTLFLLVSERPEMLLPTILSRTQQVEIPRIEFADLVDWAVKTKGAEQQQAMAAARLADGSIEELNRVLSDNFEQSREEYFKYFTALMRFSYNNRHLELLDWGEQMAALGRESQKRFIVYSIGMLRESYVLSAGLNEICYLWGSEREFCTKFAPYIGCFNIEPLVKELESALRDIGQNGNPKMIFCHTALAVSKLINKR